MIVTSLARLRLDEALRRSWRPLFVVALFLVAGSGCSDQSQSWKVRQPGTDSSGRPYGGRLIVTAGPEPQTLNPVLAQDSSSLTILRPIMADLIQINRQSHETEPALASSWQISEDGRRLTLTLRQDVLFSDGHPFDADDVVFTLAVIQDQDVGSPYRERLAIDGQAIVARKIDPHTVEFDLGKPYASAARLFDSIPMLPKHLLEERYESGELAAAWTLDTEPNRIAGLGPFRYKHYVRGERLVLERNPHYWKTDAAGTALPYLDELVFLFIASSDDQVDSFQNGDIDVLDHFEAESFAVLEREQARRGHTVYDLGPGLTFEFLFFNLNALPGNAPDIAAKQAWFRQKAFRQALSAAIDREKISRLVYGGRGTPIWSHVTSGNRRWFNANVPQDGRSLERARTLLRSEGFSWQDGALIDAEGERVAFSIVTSANNDNRFQMMARIQQDLGQLGIDVQLKLVEFQALLDRLFNSYDYEACLLGLGGGDVDPNGMMNVLQSSGRLHLWNPGQREPVAPWEADLDRLMARQAASLEPAERKAIYDRVQELVAEHLPLIPLVSPNVLVGARSNLGNFRPAILGPRSLWNVEELYWK